MDAVTAADSAAEGTKAEPQLHWKFAVKAAHVKAVMLANCMEYAIPKRIMWDFAEPVLVRLLKKFVPELFPEETERVDENGEQ